MINLLPPENRRILVAGRTNLLLSRYIILVIVVQLVIIAEAAGLYLYNSNKQSQNQLAISQNEQKTAEYTTVKQKAEQFRNDLASAKAVLSGQVSFTSLITGISSVITSGATLDRLVVDPATFGSPTQLVVHVKSPQVAIDMKARMQASPYFSSAKFLSIAQSSDSSKSGYPYDATFEVVFKKELVSK